MATPPFNIHGLTNDEVIAERQQHGYNRLEYKKQNSLVDAIKGLAKEPMVVLLLFTSSIYFVTGEIGDGIFLAAAIVLVSAISLYQDSRSRNALEKLKSITTPRSKVIRNCEVIEVKSEELVVGDCMMIEEGGSIAADGVILQSNDFAVNESILTGESMAVSKEATSENKYVYHGTSVTSGMAVATITAIGNETKLGKIGKSLESIVEEKTPLEMQIGNFVKKMVLVGVVVFIIVWGINLYHSHLVIDSLLKALTLAMSILPQEIPVAFTTFMALGAWRLMKMGIVVKQMKTVETLGSATTICIDKTGTLTENKMSLAKLFVLSTNTLTTAEGELGEEERALIRLAMFASEPVPFDPMEVALHAAYTRITSSDDRPQYKLVKEYALSGKPPMMTHIFQRSDERIVAAKGAPEALINAAQLSQEDKRKIDDAITTLSADGYRVLGVGQANTTTNAFPSRQAELKFAFKGLVAFYDPPKKNIQDVLASFYTAGITVKIITGDNAATTSAIAKQVGFVGYDKSISGEELMKLPDVELKKSVLENALFTRMFPEAKLKIINALKDQQQIVAMTGDGVNDGPALKSAHIGIAMGKKGTEIAKQAASLILADDDLTKMIDAVAMGRKIYANLKKAIQYVISIHIPIILTVFIPLALGWVYPNIFSPVHIIFLELIMDPTCSIIYENEPMEENTMTQKPRPFSLTFFNGRELFLSSVQGLLITIGTLVAYQLAVYQGWNEDATRTIVFVVLVSANIFLTLVNRSFYYSIFATMKYKNNLVGIVLGATIVVSACVLYIKPLSVFFAFQPLTFLQLSISILIGFVSVIWFEGVKWRKRNNG